MTDIARHLKFEGQPPALRLVFSFCVVVVAGTLFFWIFLWAGSMIFNLSPADMVKLPSPRAGNLNSAVLKYVQFSQHFGIFLLPSALVLWLMNSDFNSSSWLKKSPEISAVALVCLLGFLLIPFLGFTAGINEKLVLPESLSGVQDWMREKEDTASALTGILISSGTVPGLLLNIFLLSVLPAFSEELLFRGIFQKLFIDLFRRPHIGIWVTAIIFSSIHLQFFGFLPRLILGLIFGYLFYWSGNLWYPVVAHLINNAIPVVSAYLNGWSAVNNTTPVNGNLLLPLVSLLATAAVLYSFRSVFSKKSSASGD